MQGLQSIRFLAIGCCIVLYASCIKSYAPPAIKASNQYLVVDGYINTAPGGITRYRLTRSRNLADTSAYQSELGAQVSVVSASGTIFPLLDSFSNGNYTSAPLNLDPDGQYKLQITTSNGHQYVSALVATKSTQPIDSLNWARDPATNGVNIYVNTHDPSNLSLYYRWDYTETWEHQSPEIAQWVLINGIVEPLGADYLNDPRQIHSCWTTVPASHITVGTSVGLSQDLISHQLINKISYNDERLTVRYSMLVNQYALSQDAYNYWVLIQNNSQNLGGLFDLTPSQLNSNIVCTTNPAEPVIGYVSASTLQQQRLFISHSQVPDWITQEPYNQCLTETIPTDPNNFQLYTFEDTSYAPWYFTGNNIPDLVVVKKYCVDCRTQGGTNTKPLFW
jgi:hypothetical protein